MTELKRYIYELRDEVNRDHGVCIDLEIEQLLKAVDPMLTDNAELNRKAHLDKNMTILALEARIKELESQVPAWVSVDERFNPSKDGDYFCIDDEGKILVTECKKDGWVTDTLRWVEFWLDNLPPLPTAPTEEKDDDR